MLLLVAVGTMSGSTLRAQDRVPTPAEVLGLEIGTDSVLADWSQIGTYLTALAAASPRVRLDTIGRTTLGRPMLLVTLTSPENQLRLDHIRRGQALLADPRLLDPVAEDSLIRIQPAVVFINNNIHSTEIGSSQFSLLLAHRLATDPEYQRFLQDVVVLLTPSANPDGLDTVVAWYREYKGTPFEGGPLPWLYHPYVGHDNNRDWFMLTQVETKTLARVLYREWYPEVVWDVHQMGNSGARLFLPPFSDPVNPNIDPLVLEATNLVGTAMATALYDAGKTGVIHQSRFDLWWHGGFRSVPARHNMIGILSEAASARLASPIDQPPAALRQDPAGVNYPAPWPGGRWGIGDIVEYELLAADGLLRLVAGERETFVRRFVTVGRRSIAAGAAGNPYAYLIPPDQRDRGAVAAFIELLIGAGVE
ncbi:MAG: peptidase M14, partial [Gemmatimonadales bacterium]|nr:peptidase M14 [Gemmatimonadales bacterium]